LRHTSLKKNTTDGVDSTSYVPLRDIIAFIAVMNETIKPYLSARGHAVEDVEKCIEPGPRLSSYRLHFGLSLTRRVNGDDDASAGTRSAQRSSRTFGSAPSKTVAGQVLRIAASGLNPLDARIRSGSAEHAKHPVPLILGIDTAGRSRRVFDLLGQYQNQLSEELRRVHGQGAGLDRLPDSMKSWLTVPPS